MSSTGLRGSRARSRRSRRTSSRSSKRSCVRRAALRFGTGCGPRQPRSRFPEGPQGQNVGRTVAIMSGLPSSVPGSTVSRFCASGLNAIAIAARMIEGGSYDIAIAGGLESITMLQNDYNRKNLQNPWLLDHKKDIYMPMGQTAEVVAERYGVTRDRQDEFALVSQQRTAAGQRQGQFADAIVPIT